MSDKLMDGCIGCVFPIFFFVLLPLLFLALAWTMSPWGCERRWPDQETDWQPFMCYVVIDGVRYPERAVRVIDGSVEVER